MSQAQAATAGTSEDSSFSYDEVPYESYAYRDTHPDHLYLAGKLFGMNPPDFKTARVLELGCAAGGNLLPYALAFPESKCIGIDLSIEEINEGNHIKNALKVKNVELLQKDIMKIGKDFGTFDYIIAHGVFSWVPDFVRDKILELCRNNLSENGIAMISYNAYPGWHGVTALRDIMRYHSQAFKEPREKVMQSRSLLNFLSQNAPKTHTFYKEFIDKERETLSNANETYIYHDHLADINNPYYLYQFNDMLVKSDLQYVGDTSLTSMYLKNMGTAAAAQFSKLKDHIRQEQYIDFLLNRRFRMSIVTHAAVKLNRTLNAEQIFDFYLTSNVAPVGDNPGPHREVVFKKIQEERHFSTKDPVSTAFFLALYAAGRKPVSVKELAQTVKTQLNLPDTEPVMQLARQCGIDFAFSGFIELHAIADDFVTTVSEKPVAYALARYEAKANPERKRLTSAARHTGGTNKFLNLLLGYCDGKNDIDSLVEKMLAHVKDQDFTLIDPVTKNPLRSDDTTREKIETIVSQVLENCAKKAFLVG